MIKGPERNRSGKWHQNKGKSMNIIKFDDPIRFQSKVKDYLLKHEAENNLPLGILSSLIAGEYVEVPPYLALVEDHGEPQLVLMRTPPYPVLFSFEPNLLDEEIVDLVIGDLLYNFGDELTGMTGNKDLVSHMAESWKLTTGKQAVLKMAMRIYKLEQVNPISGVPGSMRPANDGDKSLLLEWYGGFHRDALQEEPDSDQVQKQVERYLNADPVLRGMMIWEEDEKPVSMAGYTGPTAHGIRIGAVYTPPEIRRQGYASACVAELSQHLLDQGFQFCFLFTDLLNPTSNHIYQQVGYIPVNDVDTYDFK